VTQAVKLLLLSYQLSKKRETSIVKMCTDFYLWQHPQY